MDKFSNISITSYRDEVIAELVGEDEQGDIEVVTYQFEFEAKPDRVRPKQTIKSAHRTAVEQALEEHGYSLA